VTWNGGGCDDKSGSCLGVAPGVVGTGWVWNTGPGIPIAGPGGVPGFAGG